MQVVTSNPGLQVLKCTPPKKALPLVQSSAKALASIIPIRGTLGTVVTLVDLLGVPREVSVELV